MSDIWIFWFCIVADTDDFSCPREHETKPSYEVCAEAQLQYHKDHYGEDFVTGCRRVKRQPGEVAPELQPEAPPEKVEPPKIRT